MGGGGTVKDGNFKVLSVKDGNFKVSSVKDGNFKVLDVNDGSFKVLDVKYENFKVSKHLSAAIGDEEHRGGNTGQLILGNPKISNAPKQKG